MSTHMKDGRMHDHSDGFSKPGADRLADTIEKYWRSHGYRQVRAWSYRLGGTNDWGVQSNLVAGMPPR